MTCSACGDKPQKAACGFPKAVVEIDNPEQINLFRKVVVPTSMGDDREVPPAIGKYRNVLLNYEANNHTYLYSSDGIPTLLSSDVAETIEQRVKDLEIAVADEIETREKADDDLKTLIDTKADTSSLAPVATSGNYNDLTNKPTIGDATLTVQRNSTDVGTFTANSTTDTTINISVPTTPADIGAQAEITSDNKLDADLVDDTNSTNKFVTAADLSAISTALQPADIDKVVMTDLDVSSNTSTTTVALEAAKENLMSGAQTTKSIALPVASTTEAGVMNSSTFDAVTNNTANINALLNGAVAITGLSASPSQSDITTAWQTETGLTTLINRASVYDVTNDKVWTYYTNDTTWHAASNTTQVTINTFTNSSEGTIKGSTNTGQIFAENDGTGSVNGWDALNAQVSDNTNNIGTLQTAMTNKQDKLTAGSNITISSNTISATDTTYTAGTGLTLAGTQFSADTSVLQEKLTAGNAIDITSNVISADIYPADYFTAGATTTSTGSNITLNNTLEAKLDSVELYGDTTQQTYSGKNLIQPIANGTHTSAGITWTVSGDSIVGSGTASTSPSNITDSNMYFVTPLPAGTYTFSLQEPASRRTTIFLMDSGGTGHNAGYVEANGTSVTFTTNYTAVYYRIASGQLTTGTQYDITYINKFQLEAGSTATAFEPYVGETPAPNPDYPQNVNVVTGEQTVTVTGKNLFDKNDAASIIDKMYINANSSTFALVGGSAAAKTIYIPCLPNTAYTVSKNAGTRFIVATSIAVPQNGGQADDIITDNTAADITITTGANAKYLVAWVYNSTDTGTAQDMLDSVQIEQGSTATAYEPYQSESYTVDLGSTELCKIGDYQDYVYKSGDDWYVHKETGYISLDSLSWQTAGTLTTGIYKMRADVSAGTYLPPSISSEEVLGLCTHYGAKTEAQLNNLIEGLSGNTAGTRIFIYDPSYNTGSSASEFQTWINTAKPIFYYVLATATDTQITDADLITDLNALAGAKSYLDVTNFTITATGTNLPALLAPTAYRNSAAGVAGTIGVMPDQQVQSDWAQVDTTAVDYIKNKPALATVATTGDYDDLIDKPALATVATSGSYADLTNKPTIPAAQVNSDWNSNSGVSKILNKPTLATVATSGSYTDLTNKPTIPAAQIQSDWTQTNTVAKDYIKNKPTIPNITMTNVDPGEGGALAAGDMIGVYGGDPIILDYSTNEINTGAKWIDGSAIYKKTVPVTTSTSVQYTTIPHGITNFGKVIKYEGFLEQSNNLQPIPRVVPDNANYGIGIGDVNATSFIFIIGSSVTKGTNGYVTLYYTKSS